ncbi:MAG: glycoside hydrolase family 172 protein [Armatimonadota bacterium]
MKLRIIISAAIFLAFAGFAHAEQLFPMLNGLPVLKDYKAMRNSSTDPNWEDGNGDARPIMPGKTLTLAELKGPGQITHIWFTIADNERFYGKKLVLKMYWDDEKTPSVESPINDFFCQGHGLDMKVNSLPIRVTADGKARNCYFAMPFKKSARIEITNEGKEPVHAMYWYIDWQKMDKLAKDTAYFHAKYRQEYPCVSGKDYLILSANGKGHYVGCNLSVRNQEAGWWGEGDDRFYIDGEEKPSIMGTGTEDFLCDGWGIREMEGLFYGAPLVEGYGIMQKATAYRFNIQDPVPFNKSLKVTIEHKGARMMPDGNWNGYVERADDFSSVAYWYQTEPHVEFTKMPPVEMRLYPYNAIPIEGESLLPAVESKGGNASNQQMIGWSNNDQLFFTPQTQDASFTVKFKSPKEGRYTIYLYPTKSWDYGFYKAYLDGAPAGKTMDLYAQDVTSPKALSIGTFQLSEGDHTLKFECMGKNPLSDGYFLGLDMIELLPAK